MGLRHLTVAAVLLGAPFALLIAPGAAHAQDFEDDDEFVFDDEADLPESDDPPEDEEGDEEGEEADGSEPPEAPPTDPSGEVDLLGDDEDIDFFDPVGEETEEAPAEDLFSEDPDAPTDVLAPGTDDADTYRAKQREIRGMASDEEVMAWEAYLEEYPNSIFRERIEERVDTLLSAQYRLRLDEEGEAGRDADDAELLVTQSLRMPNINPRTRLGAAFAFGFPGYFGGKLDFEYAFLRNVSARAGLEGRYSGWGLDLGAKYAFVKSQRLQFVATVMTDVRLNFAPLQFMVRPQLGFGKIVGPAQILLTVGADITARGNAGVALLGGLHVNVRVAPPVAIFAESDAYVRNLGRTQGEGVFTFDNVTFGLKFYPGVRKRTDDPLEIAAGGTIPVARQYLEYYLGSVQAQANYFFPDR